MNPKTIAGCVLAFALVGPTRAFADAADPPPPKPIVVSQYREPVAATRRPGIYGPGIAIAAIGVALLAGSAPFFASGSSSNSGGSLGGAATAGGALLAGVGAVHLLIGIPMIAVGVTPKAPSQVAGTWPPSVASREVTVAFKF